MKRCLALALALMSALALAFPVAALSGPIKSSISASAADNQDLGKETTPTSEDKVVGEDIQIDEDQVKILDSTGADGESPDTQTDNSSGASNPGLLISDGSSGTDKAADSAAESNSDGGQTVYLIIAGVAAVVAAAAFIVMKRSRPETSAKAD